MENDENRDNNALDSSAEEFSSGSESLSSCPSDDSDFEQSPPRLGPLLQVCPHTQEHFPLPLNVIAEPPDLDSLPGAILLDNLPPTPGRCTRKESGAFDLSMGKPGLCQQVCQHGPGFPSPFNMRMLGGPELIIYVVCTNAHVSSQSGSLTVIDAQNGTTHKSAVMFGNDYRRFTWNSCSCSYMEPSRMRSDIIVCDTDLSEVIVYNLANAADPIIRKILYPKDLVKDNFTAMYPLASHCTPEGKILIQYLSDGTDRHRAGFLVMDGKNYEIEGRWSKDTTPHGYDFMIKPSFDTLISTGWAAPHTVKKGFRLKHINKGRYGHQVYIWCWSERRLVQTIDLGKEDGLMPLCVQFLHNPDRSDAFVCCAYSGCIFRLCRTKWEMWACTKVIIIESKKVKGWKRGRKMDSMFPLTAHMVISLDDQYLFVSNWLHGDIRQYDITNTKAPIYINNIFLGGSLTDDVISIDDPEMEKKPLPIFFTSRRIKFEGGPHMMQLSLDGRRLYATNSFYKPWDKQFYPDLLRRAGGLVQVRIEENRSLNLNKKFYISFAAPRFAEYDGQLPSEIKFLGGDCTSELFLPMPSRMMDPKMV